MNSEEIYLEPDFKVVSEKVYIKVYSFEKNKVVYSGTNPITNGDHPVCWIPGINMLVLESGRSGWVDVKGHFEEEVENFRGKFNLCVSNRPIRDAILKKETEIHTAGKYLLSGKIGEEECFEISFLDEGDCLFITVRDPIVERQRQEEFEKWDNED